MACAIGHVLGAEPGKRAADYHLSVDWTRPSGVLQTVPSLQVVTNPLLRPGSPLRDSAFRALKNLGANDVRFVPWYPFPKLAVPELAAPRDGKTSWNFSLIDPLVTEFFTATRGHPIIMNFSTIPQWMFRQRQPVRCPANPDRECGTYSQAPSESLIDPQEVGKYFARIVSWYTRGGFTDEYGHYHYSGYHFKIPYWEVLNEPDVEHGFTAEQYTAVYDAIVAAIHKVSPKTKFVGLALAFVNAKSLPVFKYFLNPRNHRPGTPINMISMHFYAHPGRSHSMAESFFNQANKFVATARRIERLRNQLSPQTQLIADEVGSLLPEQNISRHRPPISKVYWNLSGALYAYVYVKLARLGFTAVNESQLVGYPTEFPEVSMLDWRDGKPNARYWVLDLLRDQLTIGDSMYPAQAVSVGNLTARSPVVAQGYKSATGVRKILIINTGDKSIRLTLGAEVKGGRLEVVDESTEEGSPRISRLRSNGVPLEPFAVAVVRFPRD
ncbi:MAG: glycosyl hydrolase family 39 [Pseudomonadota bacterium]|jgi:hypothetical protein|nr:glycosyl hydrolase family 39 [Pseudomonadota bacterium]